MLRRFYKNLLSKNRKWLVRILAWAIVWFFAGIFVFILRPDFLAKVLEFLHKVFKEILGQEHVALDFRTALLIWKQNLTAAFLNLFLGIVFGLVPLFSVAINFFILGFLLAVFIFSSGPHISGLVVFLISVLPHAIIEIPVFLISAAFGLKLGFSWGNLRYSFKENVQILPLVIALLVIAAFIETFVSGNLVKFFTPTPESHVRKGMDEWLSGSEFRPPKERRNSEKKDAMGVSPWRFTK